MKLQYSNENIYKNKNKFSSLRKDINRKEQEYLIKYHKLFGDSFSDQELLDIFAKNDYDEQKIIIDIKALLSIGNNKISDEDNDNLDDYHLPSFGPNKNEQKYKYKYIKEEKIFVHKFADIPSDYAAPPEEEENEIMEYKRGLFEKLKTVNNTYKSNKNLKEEINFDDYVKNEKKDNNNRQNEIKLIEFDKKNNNIKNSQSFQKKKLNQNNSINKELKKKYIQNFFNNMKNYSKDTSNKTRRNNYEKSSDYGKRKNILSISPDKDDFYEKQIYTYKKGIKNHYLKSNNNHNNMKIESKVNDVFILACYDNPQREQFLKMINEKRKQNPDKVIEFLIPQFSPMNTLPYYSNISPQYSQYNPYMNMYMMPSPPQYAMQNPILGVSMSNQIQNSNINNQSINNNNIPTNFITHENQNSLTNLEAMQLSNNNIQPNYQMNNNSIQNSFMMNNNVGMHKNKSSGNFSNSGNINTTSSFK